MLFQPSNIYPSTLSGIGAGTVDVTQGINVSWQVNGDTPMTAYQIKIYQNDTSSTLLYDSGAVSVSPAFETHDKYGNPTFYSVFISAAALSTAGIVNGYHYGYKMLITQWWGVSDYVEQTSASVFITRSLPTISIDAIPNPVTSSSLTITATYAQAQGDPISTVDWVFALAGSESNPIKNTGAVNTQVLSFDADGLITGNTYSIMCTVVTANGMEASTGFVQFTVSYSSSSLGINYQLAQLKNSSAVYLSWDDLGSNVLSYPYTDSTKTTNGITFTVNGEGDVVANGTASADAYFTIASGTLSQLGLTANQKLLIFCNYSGARIEVTSTNSSNVVVTTISGTDPLQYIVPYTTDTLKFYIVIPSGTALGAGQQLQPMIALEDKIVAYNDVSVNIEPIQSGSGDPSPSNVRPISGLTDLSVYRTGKNLFGGTLINGYIPLDLPVGTYTVSADMIDSSQQTYFYIRRAASGTTAYENVVRPIVGLIVDPKTFSVEAGYDYYAWCNSSYINVKDVQFELGSTATDYEPYNGNTYSVDWTSEAGTVYGGTLDVVTGLLTVDMAIVTITGGATNASKNYSKYRISDLNDVIPSSDSNKTICTVLKNHQGAPSTIPDDGFTVVNSTEYNGDFVYIRFSGANTATTSSERAQLTNQILEQLNNDGTPLQLVYELATPLTYQLASQEVTTPFGTNNVWSDGEEVTVGYTKNDGTHVSINGSVVTFSDSNAQIIPTPPFVPGITGISIYRYLQGESSLQHVYDLSTGATSILDYYAPSQMMVSYLIVAHSGIGDLFLQTNQFTPTFWFYSILLCDTDSNGNYHVSKEYIFKYGVETGAVSNNNGPTIQKNFTPYPNRQPVSCLYKTGKLTGYIGKVNRSNLYSDSVSLQNAIYEISVSPLTKFLKSRKGDVIKVEIASPIQMQKDDKTVEQALKATVEWVETGDCSDASIISIPTDSFWPI